ncbi:dihydroxyacetone kinase subunit DhaL [Roseovarius autotrophicus]|uniref:dihydroxyacetone kinase subunit DhaL n=1 Tax=Roseovarius autotrophicus TaxID=2824121 RepID=UPI001B36733E|nr:dihydroxyacetone kinase subunit DhaL [Roseovarius autotrophicus]
MAQLDKQFIADVFHLATARLEDSRQMLCRLDGEIGDGDHGSSMANGFAAIDRVLRSRPDAEPPEMLRLAAQAFLAEVGATVGPLYASAFLEVAALLDAKSPLPMCELGAVLSAFATGIAQRGKAQPGDKTMLDVWLPAAQSAQRAARDDLSLARMAALIRSAADTARDETAALMSTRGRAARLQERSIGHLDPGAVSSAVIIGAICDIVAERAA